MSKYSYAPERTRGIKRKNVIFLSEWMAVSSEKPENEYDHGDNENGMNETVIAVGLEGWIRAKIPKSPKQK